MKRIHLLTMALIAMTTIAHAQWTLGVGTGPAFPITGYAEVVEPGMNIFNLQGNQQVKSGPIRLGMNIQMARFAKDKNPEDAFYEAKITVAPVLFTIDYTFCHDCDWQPYLSAGIGLSFYVVSYNSSPDTIDDQSDFNTNFTMMPKAGLRYRASDHLYPFIETGLVTLMDGPPVGFPEGYNVTGYQFVALGVSYTFDK